MVSRSSFWLRALSVPYGWVTQGRNRLYDRGWLSQRRLPCRVVSIGNLTVGGTGKTPVTIAVTEALLAAGHRVAVLSRGYRRRSRAPRVLVSDGQKILVGPDEAGDEPFLIAQRCPGAIVAVAADRYQLGRWVLAQHRLDCVVLDDGFQHRALARDVDLLLVDASDTRGLHALVPAGRLREPLSSAARATALLVTRVDGNVDAQPIVAIIQRATGKIVQPILIRFMPQGMFEVSNGSYVPPENIAGQRVVLFSGIGNAGAFRDSVLRQGLIVVDEVVFPDHHAYSISDVDRVQARAAGGGASVLVTTEKDAVKLQRLPALPMRVWAVRLETQIFEGEDRFKKLIFGETAEARGDR
ncbi:MAG TPA: tetraacyldisaccharide 4'-kinase [Nitrospiraceae bacterium]|nr:tetraacyldisaccharide 4'-kinase [Nitrospiraceae bacterium]